MKKTQWRSFAALIFNVLPTKKPQHVKNSGASKTARVEEEYFEDLSLYELGWTSRDSLNTENSSF